MINKAPKTNHAPASLIFDGDANACAEWVPYARVQLSSMRATTHGTTHRVISPKDGVEIHLSAITNSILIRTGKIKVCWLYSLGSEFVNPSGTVDQKTDNWATTENWLFGYFGQGYWVNSGYSNALSFGTSKIFYRGKRYGVDSTFSSTKNIVAAKFVGAQLVILYVVRSTQLMGMAIADLVPGTTSTNGTITISTNSVNLSSVETGSMYAGFGGNELIWIVSRDDELSVSNSTNTAYYVSCYSVSLDSSDPDNVVPALTFVKKQTLSSQNHTEKTVATSITDSSDALTNRVFLIGGPTTISPFHAPTGNTQAIQRIETSDYTVAEDVTDFITNMFVQGGKLSVARKTSSLDEVYSSTTTIDGTAIEADWAGRLDWVYWWNTSTQVESHTINESIDLKVDVFSIVDGLMNQSNVFTESIVSKNYSWNNTTEHQYIDPGWTFTLISESNPDPTPTTVLTADFQYADGINNIYVISYSNTSYVLPTSTKLQKITVKGRCGTIDDFPVTTTLLTGPWNVPSIPSAVNTTYNANQALINSQQGRDGSYDSKTYLLQTQSISSPTRTALAINNANEIVIRTNANKESLTIGFP